MGTCHCLKTGYILFGNLLLLLLVVHCSESDASFKVEGGLKLKSPLIARTNGSSNSNEEKDGPNFGSDTIVATHVKKDEQIPGPKEVVQKDFGKTNVSESLAAKEIQRQKNFVDSSNVELKDRDKQNGDTGELVDSKRKTPKHEIEESSGFLTGMVKEKLRDEECDPSNMCVDKKKNLTACLRVPGNDSPDLSLLIQNKGASPVAVTITAPEFIQLEETKVQLKPKEDKKVKVSLAYEGMDSLIFIITEDNRCTLNLKELIPHDSKPETRYAFKLRYLNNLTRTRCMIFLTLTAFLVFGSAWMCLGLRKKLVLRNGYQTLGMELLPVSDVSRTAGSQSDDGWNNSWDDHWDDEEAPGTPTLPSTPNLSSRGLAPRRLSKEAWKD